jgi:ABC-type Fe3+ transport system substrate-binding protein
MTRLIRCGLPARKNVPSLPGLARYFAASLVLLLSPPILADGRVVMISPHNESIRYEFGRGFNEWHRNHFNETVTLEWRDAGGTTDALRFVQSEFATKTGGIGIDIFFGGGPEPFLLLADKKLSSPYRPPDEILAGIPQSFNGIEVYDAGHQWHGAALSSFGILQNTRVQQRMNLPFVNRWDQLAGPELHGWVGIGDPRNSGTMNNMFEGFLQAHGWDRGWELLTEIAGNARKFDRISSTTAKDVTLGETAYAFAIDFYAFTQIAVAGRTNMTFALPQDFTAISPDGIAILKGAPNLVFARRFIDFVLGEDGQRLWFLPRGNREGPRQYSIERMSVRPDFYKRYHGISNIEFSPFELKQSFRYDAKLARDRREIVAALAGAFLVDTQTELRAAWRSVMEHGLPADERKELGRMPLTESEAFQLSTGAWKDPEIRNRKKIEWQTLAQRKYRRIVEGRASRVESQKTATASGSRRSYLD